MTACRASLPALPGRLNQKSYGLSVRNILPPADELSLLSSVELERLGGRVYNALVDNTLRDGGLSRAQVFEVLRQYQLDCSLPEFSCDTLFSVMADSSSPYARVSAEAFLDFFPALMGLVTAGFHHGTEGSIPVASTTRGTGTTGPNRTVVSPAVLTNRRHSGAQAGVRNQGWHSGGPSVRTGRGTSGLKSDRYALGSRNLGASTLVDRRTGHAARSTAATITPAGAMARIPEQTHSRISRRSSQYSVSATDSQTCSTAGSPVSRESSAAGFLPSLSSQEMRKSLRNFGGRMASFLRPMADNGGTLPSGSVRLSGNHRRSTVQKHTQVRKLPTEIMKELDAVFRPHGVPSPGTFALEGRGVCKGLQQMGWGQSEIARAFVELFLQVPRRRLLFNEFMDWYLADISGAPKEIPGRCVSDKSLAWEKALTPLDMHNGKHKGWGSMPTLSGIPAPETLPGIRSAASSMASRRDYHASVSRRCTT